MLSPEYIKDMQNSYLLLPGGPQLVNDYKSKMLHHNNISHILNMEIHSLNETNIYYYNITNLRKLSEIYQTITYTKKDIRTIISIIIDVMKSSFEYMLKENDFIIHPDYIYMGDSIEEVHLCYYSNYNVDIQEQLIQLTEYIMNRVDYKDRQAVLLIYSLYRVMREDNCSYEKILDTLNSEEIHRDGLEEGNSNNGSSLVHRHSSHCNLTQLETSLLEKSSDVKKNDVTIKKGTISNKGNKEYNIGTNIENKIESVLDQNIEKRDEYLPMEEHAVDIYPKRVYVLGVVIGILGIILFIIGGSLGIFHNSFGTSINIAKLICGLLILGLGEYYIQSQIFTNKHKVSKVIVPESNSLKVDNFELEKGNQRAVMQMEPTELIHIPQSGEEETVLIKHMEHPYYLKPQNEKEYKYIEIRYFPYVIGKSKGEVDYIFNSSTVSRKHCTFQWMEGEVFVTDLGSTNGTYVNHRKITPQEMSKIMDGDTIRIGNHLFTLHKEL